MGYLSLRSKKMLDVIAWQTVIIIAWYVEAAAVVMLVRRYLSERKRTTTGWARYRESRPVNLHGFIVRR